MKKNIFKSTLLVILAVMMMVSSAFGVFAEKVDYMAYNIYSDPDLSATSREFTGFTIEFRGTKTPLLTYWALCNFGLGFSPEMRAKYPGIYGGGAYAGLQNTDGENSRKGIIAFWDIFYDGPIGEDGKPPHINPTRMYPNGPESNFGGEGEGTNWISGYEWEDNKWYRMLLLTWDDKDTGNTFVGQWFQDMESGKWTLFSVFNTKLKGSYLTGAMSLFQENYVNDFKNVREFNVKNTYVIDRKKNEWVSIPRTTISYGNGGAANKMGAHSFGIADNKEYIWGQAGGEVDNQQLYEATAQKSGIFTVNQADKPVFGGDIKLGKTVVRQASTTSKDRELVWTLSEDSTPQMSYAIEVYDVAGNKVYEKTQTRPDISKVRLEGVTDKALKYKISITDIFGKTAVFEESTKEYKKAMEEANATPTPTVPVTTTEPSEGGLSVGAIIGIVAAAVVVVGGAIVAVIVFTKKKK